MIASRVSNGPQSPLSRLSSARTAFYAEFIALALTSFFFGCSKDPPDEGGRASLAPGASSGTMPSPSKSAANAPSLPAPKRPYNVLLIMIDSLRADMPWAGYERPIAPWLTHFAERCTVYPRAYSLSSYTAKSVAPALVGEYPSAMARDGRFFTLWPDENVFVSERLQELGHRTLAGHGHGYFLPALGLNQGFDDYRLLPGTFLDPTGVHDITSEKLNGLAKKMLSVSQNVNQSGGRRFFAYFHFLDPHYTYYKHDGHPDFGKGRRDLYDNEVHFTDHWVGDLVDWALAEPWGKQTAVIITADHGEGFGEHGHYRHSYELWEALVRVPLFICVPEAPAHRISVPRGHIDLAPTILDLLGAKSDTLRGKSLLPEVFGAETAKRPVVIDLPRSDLMDRRRAIIDDDTKLISFGDDKSFLLFDVVDDPKEEHDLSESRPEELDRMKNLYESLWAEIPNRHIVGSTPLKGAPVGRGF